MGHRGAGTDGTDGRTDDDEYRSAPRGAATRQHHRRRPDVGRVRAVLIGFHLSRSLPWSRPTRPASSSDAAALSWLLAGGTHPPVTSCHHCCPSSSRSRRASASFWAVFPLIVRETAWRRQTTRPRTSSSQCSRSFLASAAVFRRSAVLLRRAPSLLALLLDPFPLIFLTSSSSSASIIQLVRHRSMRSNHI